MRIGFFGDSLTEGLPGVPYVGILQERFPSDELVNFGRGGDSVVGTLQRVRSLRSEKPFDLAFVWTGVNDVLARISWASPRRVASRGSRGPIHETSSSRSIVRFSKPCCRV